jgi:heme-degrading monooxygenase HmoA
VYARVASFENRDMSMADQLVGRVRERVRSGGEIPDAKGFLMLIDRRAGTALGISFFESEEAIRKAEPEFERMGQQIPKEMRGKRLSVDTYEVAIQEGGEGARAARVSSLEGPPENIDKAVRVARDTVLPKARQLSGWKGVISLVDRKSGRGKLITLWESEEALRASEEQANKLRQETAESAGEKIKGVDRYEVAVAERISQPIGVRT